MSVYKNQAKKIMIIGSGGAGKSTLARQLAAILDIEAIYLDAFYWQPGWVEIPTSKWHSVVQDLSKRKSWIIDGNYGDTLDLRLAVADTVIFLDFSRLLCLWRVIKRRLIYSGKTRPDMASGCPERIDGQFLHYIWNYPIAHRPIILKKLSQLTPNQQVIILKSPAEVRLFLQKLQMS